MSRIGIAIAFIFATVLSVLHTSTQPVTANSVDNFRFESFHADYYLSKDDDGRSNLRVVETLVALFPDYNQNKGIYRSIPYTYDGHGVSVDIISLTRNGITEPIYSEERANGHIIIATGDDSYVRGEQTYEITYTMRDVTKDFGDKQEFYWDVNGFDWKQSFGEVSASVHLDDSIVDNFTGGFACYMGVFGSSAACGLAEVDNSTLHFSTDSLVGRGANLTVAIEFEKDTFMPYDEGLIGVLRPYVVGGSAVIAIFALGWSVVSFTRVRRQGRGRGIIVPQYLPPEDSMRMAAGIMGKIDKYIPAQTLELAVGGNIRIIETEKPGIFGKKKVYVAELISINGLGEDARGFVQALFGGTKPGSRYEFTPKYDTDASKLADFISKISADLTNNGYNRKSDIARVPVFVSVLLLAALTVGIFTIFASTEGLPLQTLLFVYAVVSLNIFAITMILVVAFIKPLNEKGVELRDYVKGLGVYINLAEKERFRVLQSAEGALRVNVNDKEQMVRLYERLLPYAVLLGYEKSWSKELATYYTDTNTIPSWYVGMGAFNALSFSNTIGSLSTSISSASSSYSSSSGVGGGGFSGGGGGGGGGGGR